MKLDGGPVTDLATLNQLNLRAYRGKSKMTGLSESRRSSGTVNEVKSV